MYLGMMENVESNNAGEHSRGYREMYCVPFGSGSTRKKLPFSEIDFVCSTKLPKLPANEGVIVRVHIGRNERTSPVHL